MRRVAVILWAVASAAGCSDYAGPSVPHRVYALARVGSAHPPIPFNGDGTPPFLVEDTFRLDPVWPRTDQPILRRITVVRQEQEGPTTRTVAQYAYQITNGMLIYPDCPIGAVCAAFLVYAPRVFQIVGDSLFEVTPAGANIPPHVYGQVRYR